MKPSRMQVVFTIFPNGKAVLLTHRRCGACDCSVKRLFNLIGQEIRATSFTASESIQENAIRMFFFSNIRHFD
jgi:hypothetical protein